jgi:predicted TPR repeat methyltransferase
VGGLGPDDLVVDIGANDGTLLSKFDCETVGVEPTGQACRIAGSTYREFFSEALAWRIVEEHGKAKVVTACNVLAHVEDIGDVMRGINVLLADDGLLIAENHDLASVVDGQWDTVYHEHLRFYDPHSFNALLEAHGFGCREWQQIPTHGGSFRMLAGRGLNPPPCSA